MMDASVTTKIAFANFIGDLTDAAVAARDATAATERATSADGDAGGGGGGSDAVGHGSAATLNSAHELQKRTKKEKELVLEAIALDRRIGGACLRCADAQPR